MSVSRKPELLDVRDYLELEKDSPVRHEYIEGQIYAMAGASDRHNRISINLTSGLDSQLCDGPCEVFMADMKVWVSESVFYYPDVVVACDGPGADPYYRKQPRLIIEVSSPDSEPIDWFEKPAAYTKVKSLREYVIVSDNQVWIELFRRGRRDRWSWELLTEISDEMHLESMGMTLTVADVYRRVRFSQRARRR